MATDEEGRAKRDAYACQRCGEAGDVVHIRPELKANHHIATEHEAITLCARCCGRIDGARAHCR
jgi:hypothetical protein